MVRPERETWVVLGSVAAITAAAAGLRFYGLGKQSFWYDEAFSVFLVHQTPGQLLNFLPVTESTPPFYYMCAWAWSRAFGMDEVGLRSISALAGTLTVPVMYLIGRRLGSHRSGLLAAALAACCPLLVWYSQEARAYSLLVLLSAIGLLFFIYARSRPAPATLAGWAAASALALATHYMAAVTVVPEALLLLYWFRRRRAVWVAVAVVFAVGCAFIPLAVEQHGTHRTAWIQDTSLGFRLGQLGAHFASGFEAPAPLLVVAAVGIAAGLLLLLRTEVQERGRAGTVAAIGVAGVLLALVLALVGLDELITRNLLAAWVPLAAALAVGFAAPRIGVAGVALAAVVCASWLIVDGRVVANDRLQRPPWSRVLQTLGSVRAPRVLVLQHYGSKLPIFIYDPTMRRLRVARVVTVREVDVIGPNVRERKGCWWGSGCNLMNARPPRRPAGFDRGERINLPSFRIVRFRSRRPVSVRIRRLRRQLHYLNGGAVLLQRPGRPANPRLTGGA
jgi:4-amino-4-deoxy-L-arabinose transferase-like glycosyltransferase